MIIQSVERKDESEFPVVAVFVDTRRKSLELEAGIYDSKTQKVLGVVYKELVSPKDSGGKSISDFS